MKNRIFIILFTVFFSAGLQANIFMSTTKKIIILEAVVTAASLNTIGYTIVTGNGLDKSIKIVNLSAKTENGKKFYEDFLLNLVLRTRYSSHPKRAHNAMDILQGSILYTPAYEQRVEKDFTEYDNTVKILTTRADRTKRKYHCLTRDTIYLKGLVLKPEKGIQDVKEWDYGSFLYLSNIDLIDDDLEHDHIPSAQAIFTYLEKRDYKIYGKLDRHTGTGLTVANNASAIEVKKSLHQQGRTWRGKQLKKVNDFTTKSFKKLYESDADNLYLATILDFTEYVLIEKGLTPLMSDAFDSIIERNTKLCLYN